MSASIVNSLPSQSNGGLPWYVILIIFIVCIIVAVATTVLLVLYFKHRRNKTAQADTKLLHAQQIK
jgi:quinol-cytochrome oxidoreductase complex cytochrome b subunit